MEDEETNLFDLLMEGSDFETSREVIVKAAFGWAGSKARSLEHLLPHLPYRKVWVDVFGGSATVTLARRPSKIEVLNDRYSGIIDFYRCMKDEAQMRKLLVFLEETVFSRELFNAYKSEWKNTADPVERAGKWFYMLCSSFGYLGRNFGRGTLSLSRANAIHNKLELFWPIHNRLKNVQIENADWEQVIKDYDSHDTVFYCDPPYMHSDVGLYDESWNLEKHKRMLSVIFNTEGFVALSGYDNELYNSMPWDDKFTWETHVTMSSKAHTETNNLGDKEGMMQKKATECLWIKH